MKTKLTQTLLLLVTVASITGARADESLSDRVKDFFKEPRNTHSPTAVAAVRG